MFGNGAMTGTVRAITKNATTRALLPILQELQQAITEFSAAAIGAKFLATCGVQNGATSTRT
ncbi:hypothetical protein AMJ80_00485 [bacterium SM23_31]|nr:MAG: hypothetical protein AMJ80_00485 [bacterium SM23_31]